MPDLLLLTKNETKLLELLKQEQQNTPAKLAKLCNIPRPTIYITLEKLKARGLVVQRKIHKKKIWELTETAIVKDQIENTKDALIDSAHSYDKIQVNSDTDITIHHGEKAVINLFKLFIENHNGSRLIGISGDMSAKAWKSSIKLKDINTINTNIKEFGLLTEMITSESWFKEQAQLFGKSWVENFIGRASQVHFIDKKYLQYSSQIFIFGNTLYLVSMEEKLFIEIKNQQIAKLIISLLKYVEDTSRTVDINQILRSILAK